MWRGPRASKRRPGVRVRPADSGAALAGRQWATPRALAAARSPAIRVGIRLTPASTKKQGVERGHVLWGERVAVDPVLWVRHRPRAWSAGLRRRCEQATRESPVPMVSHDRFAAATVPHPLAMAGESRMGIRLGGVRAPQIGIERACTGPGLSAFVSVSVGCGSSCGSTCEACTSMAVRLGHSRGIPDVRLDGRPTTMRDRRRCGRTACIAVLVESLSFATPTARIEGAQ